MSGLGRKLSVNPVLTDILHILDILDIKTRSFAARLKPYTQLTKHQTLHPPNIKQNLPN